MKKHTLIAASTMGLLAACVTAPPPPEPAVLELAVSETCTSDFVAAGAIDMTPQAPEGQTIRKLALNGETTCLRHETGQTPYALFKLPAASNIASINAGSVFEQARILGATVHLLDGELQPTRSFKANDMLHRGLSLSVLVRPKTEEKYVAVVSDPTLSGDRFNRSRPNNEDGEASDSIAYSLLGTAFVRVYYSDPAGADS